MFGGDLVELGNTLGGGRKTAILYFLLAVFCAGSAVAQDERGMTKLKVSGFLGVLEFRVGEVESPEVNVISNRTAELHKLSVSQADGEIRIEMPPPEGSVSCVSQNGYTTIQVAGRVPAALDTFPRAIVTVPRDVDLEISMVAGTANLGDLRSIVGVLGGCSRVTVGEVAEPADFELSSGAQVSVVRTNGLRLNGAGGSRLTAEAVAGETNLILAGGATFISRTISGDLTSLQGGSSRVEIQAGSIQTMDLDLARISKFKFGGTTTGTVGITAADISRIELGAVQNTPDVRSRGRGARIEIQGVVQAG